MSKKIRLALVGVGNCASSLVQGTFYYKDAKIAEETGGLMHYEIGGYTPGDIEIVAAFDIDEKKIGKDVSEAIYIWPNCTYKFYDVPYIGVPVMPGPMLDGAPEHLRNYYKKEYYRVTDKEPVDVARVLKEKKVDVIVINLPTGSHDAARFYADAAIQAGAGIVNGIPEFIASTPEINERAKKSGSPIVGDDYKSQVGATIVHRMLMKLFEDRGIKIKKSYQLNYAGNTDFINLVMRGETKHVTKHDAVASILKEDVPVAPGFAFVDNQGDQKTAIIEIEGAKFGGAPISLQLKLEVIDSPNSAGVSIDAIRCCMIAKDRGIGGVIESASAYFMKHPPKQMTDEEARAKLEEFIRG